MARTHLLLVVAVALMCAPPAIGDELDLTLRRRTADAPERALQVEPARWDTARTAVLICDMWDAHHSYTATQRVAELAPPINDFVNKLRKRGVTVIHAPSSVTGFYEDHPARQRARQAPKAANLPEGINKWCSVLPAEAGVPYPIEIVNGGCHDSEIQHLVWVKRLNAMGRNPKAPWIRQIDAIAIDDRDVISDSGAEVWNVLEAGKIDNVIVVGVHTNMCVSGRPFGLRQLARNGKNVVLARDLTDTMYNPAGRPHVSHYTGTDLVVEHIEKYICPTITSDQVTGGKAFRFSGDQRKRLVMMIGEREYETKTTLPAFAATQLGKDFEVITVHADSDDGNRFPGIEALGTADVLLVSVRRRTPPAAQIQFIRQFVAAGKPMVGLRTASHAFSLRGKAPPAGHAAWETFDPDVFGGHYSGHHGAPKAGGPKTLIRARTEAKDHVVLCGVNLAERASSGSLYKVSPLSEGTEVLMTGRFGDGRPHQPVAWTFTRKDGGRSFYTSLGHVDDFADPRFQRLLRNGIYWAAGLEISTKPAPRR